MGAILDFTNWKRLNEQATASPVTINNAISALKDGDGEGMWKLVKQFGGLENMLDILAKSGADRYALAEKIENKFGADLINSKLPNTRKALDSFASTTTWEKFKKDVFGDLDNEFNFPSLSDTGGGWSGEN
jgi:hypothetical protein